MSAPRICSALFAATVVLLLAMPAWACPYCATQERDTMASNLVIAAMVLVSFIVVPTVALFIARVSKGRTAPYSALVANETSEVC